MTFTSHESPNIGPRKAPRLGIIGGGQLAKLTASAAASFGCEVVVLERQQEFPAHSVDTHALIADWNNPAELLRLAELVDRVTLENEFVDLDALAELETQGHIVVPTVATLRLVQDKWQQKRTFETAGLPVVAYADAPTRAAVREFGFPCVLKKRRNSYDGKGNALVQTADDLPSAWTLLDGDRNALYVERYCPFERELAVIVTRSHTGDFAVYPVVESQNRDHICHSVIYPARVDVEIARRASDVATGAVVSISGVGSFGVELFLAPSGEVLINEIAPRVHNTGHYTIEACVCSQFENHVRAAFGWPLGSPEPIAPAAAMVNLLGAGPGPGTPSGLDAALAVPGARVHIYGKATSIRGRKMGHVTALGASAEHALTTARRAADVIWFGGKDEAGG